MDIEFSLPPQNHNVWKKVSRTKVIKAIEEIENFGAEIGDIRTAMQAALPCLKMGVASHIDMLVLSADGYLSMARFGRDGWKILAKIAMVQPKKRQ